MRAVLLTLAILSAPPTAFAAEITLRESASSVPGELVRLGDVATVVGAGADELAESPLMPSPVPGTTQPLSAGTIRDLLAAQGYRAADHRFRGPYRVNVSTPLGRPETAENGWRPIDPANPQGTAFRVRSRIGVGARTPSEPVAQRVRPLTAQEIEAAKERVAAAVTAALDVVRTNDDLRLAVRGVELTDTALRSIAQKPTESLVASFGESNPTTSGKVTASLRVGSEAEEQRVVADVVEQPPRVVVTMPLAKGALITTSAVKVEPVPVEELDRPQSFGYRKLEEAIGREASRAVRAGETLSDANTAAPLMVRRGEEAVVVSGGEGITVSLRVVATQEGRVGDLVTVETADRADKFIARVVGPRRLAVLAGGPGLNDSSLLGGSR